MRRRVKPARLLSTFKRVGLPEELHDARPKRLRFLLLNSVGKVVRHAHQTLLRFAAHSREPSPTPQDPSSTSNDPAWPGD